jgi:hypothetical protein
MQREEAEKLIKEYDGKRPASLDHFLRDIEMTEEEFMQIALSHEVKPYEHNPSEIEKGPELYDQKLWDTIP